MVLVLKFNRTKGPLETDWFLSIKLGRRVVVFSMITVSKKQSLELDEIMSGGLSL